jgi:hypothetical protein
MFFFGFGLWMQDAEREGRLRVGQEASCSCSLTRRNSTGDIDVWASLNIFILLLKLRIESPVISPT